MSKPLVSRLLCTVSMIVSMGEGLSAGNPWTYPCHHHTYPYNNPKGKNWAVYCRKELWHPETSLLGVFLMHPFFPVTLLLFVRECPVFS